MQECKIDSSRKLPYALFTRLYRFKTLKMNELQFEWDQQKAKINEEKHGISFEEAKSVFYDDNARLIYDSEHSLYLQDCVRSKRVLK